MSIRSTEGIRFAVHIGEDIVRVVRQDDYDIAAAVAEAFRRVREERVFVHTDHRGNLRIYVERVR